MKKSISSLLKGYLVHHWIYLFMNVSKGEGRKGKTLTSSKPE